MTFGQRIRELRHRKGLTIYEVADAISRDYTYVSKIENDRVLPPSAEIIVALATLLGADPEELAVLGDKPPVGVLRQRLAHLGEAASTVTRIWDHLARCEDEFMPEQPGACGEYRDELDTAILALMRLADPERWQQQQDRLKAATEAALTARRLRL
jgi:transcriptional regulator with XRE-family HTH domain